MTTSKKKKILKVSLLKNPQRKEARRKLTMKTKEAWGEISPIQETKLDEYSEEKKTCPK